MLLWANWIQTLSAELLYHISANGIYIYIYIYILALYNSRRILILILTILVILFINLLLYKLEYVSYIQSYMLNIYRHMMCCLCHYNVTRNKIARHFGPDCSTRPLGGNFFLRLSFRNLETTVNSQSFVSFSCSAAQNCLILGIFVSVMFCVLHSVIRFVHLHQRTN